MFGKKIAVIIPAYNESSHIKKLVGEIKNFYPDLSIIVVNDGSSDSTAQQARQAGALVLSHSYNSGYGVALQTGYKYALEQDFEIIVQLDGDGQHSVKGIEVLLNTLTKENCDLVLGSRFLPGSSYQPTLLRGWGTKFFSWCLYLLSGQKIKDSTTGFQAMTQKVFSLYVQDLFPNDYPDADVLLLLARMKFKIKEVPVVVYPAQGRKSMHSNPLIVMYYMYKMLLSMLVSKSMRQKGKFSNDT